MPFKPPEGAARERLLIYGGPKVGKSWLWLQIARMYKRTKTEGRIIVLDNDRTGRRMVGPRSENADLAEYVEIYEVDDFDEYEEVTAQAMSDLYPEDWVVVDMASNVWDKLPEWWMRNVYGDSSANYWTQVRREILAAEAEHKGHEKQFGGTSGVDWQFLKRVYMPWETKITMKAPCHIMMICEETQVQERFDKSGQKRAQFATTSGAMPKGQNSLPHRVDTMLRVTKRVHPSGKGVLSRDLTMAGDRDREHIWEEVTGRGLTLELDPKDKVAFPKEYLQGIAGWKVVKG